MASTAKAGLTARQKARQRRIALEAETKARNDRIENWTAAVFTGMEERDRALQVAALSEDAMADGLIGLAGEGLTTSEVADLCEMTVSEVQKLLKRRRDASGSEAGGPFGAGSRLGTNPLAHSGAAPERVALPIGATTE